MASLFPVHPFLACSECGKKIPMVPFARERATNRLSAEAIAGPLSVGRVGRKYPASDFGPGRVWIGEKL